MIRTFKHLAFQQYMNLLAKHNGLFQQCRAGAKRSGLFHQECWHSCILTHGTLPWKCGPEGNLLYLTLVYWVTKYQRKRSALFVIVSTAALFRQCFIIPPVLYCAQYSFLYTNMTHSSYNTVWIYTVLYKCIEWQISWKCEMHETA